MMMQALLVSLALVLAITIPFAAISWSIWKSQPERRGAWYSVFHWAWLILAVLLLIGGLLQ